MAIELRVVQFWSEIIFVISNQTRAARSFDFEFTRMISDEIAPHLGTVRTPYLTFKVIPQKKCTIMHTKRACWTKMDPLSFQMKRKWRNGGYTLYVEMLVDFFASTGHRKCGEKLYRRRRPRGRAHNIWDQRRPLIIKSAAKPRWQNPPNLNIYQQLLAAVTCGDLSSPSNIANLNRKQWMFVYWSVVPEIDGEIKW